LAELISVREAQNSICTQMHRLEEEICGLTEVCGRTLAIDIHSRVDLPPFDNSSMDGYAVCAADTRQTKEEKPVVLRVTSDIPAGKAPDVEIVAGTAARIMTGAPLPNGADAVIPVEWTRSSGSNSIMVLRPVQPGDFIRSRGTDLRSGDLVFTRGRIVQAQDVGVLAQLGFNSVPVFRRPRIAIISSGDELLQPGEPLVPGKIRDANSYTLFHLAKNTNAEVIRLGIAPDDPHKIRALLDLAVEHHADLIISSAGVSVGEYDYVRKIIEEDGTLSFWRVNMRPGKPLAFGNYRGIPIFGLPGNPVSAFVGFLVFVEPAIHAMTGGCQTNLREIEATTQEEILSDGRESYLRAIVKRSPTGYSARLTDEHQGSGNLLSLSRANALLIVPSGVKCLPSGTAVKVWLLDNFKEI
jgi:molybdopterin molybdotransferase